MGGGTQGLRYQHPGIAELLGTHLTSTFLPFLIYSPFSGTAFSLRPCRSYTAVFLLFVPQQGAVCGLTCGLHLDLRRATVIK